MQFTHPELLYALFLLLIPIIIHLFRLRRFQKEEFTNVKFLKKISRETRKSSSLKKWLILITRMLILASIIIAFAQPFVPPSKKALQEIERIIYLDNSHSMQAIGSRGALLPASIQAILENLPNDKELSLITNDEEFLNIAPDQIKIELQNIGYSSTAFDFQNVRIRTEQYFSKNRNTRKEIVFISDFQQNLDLPSNLENGDISYHFIPQRPEITENISVDSVYIAEKNIKNIQLKVQLSSSYHRNETIPISLFDADELLAKTSAEFNENRYSEAVFTIENTTLSKGRIEIEDNNLRYDNTLFFSINETKEIETVIISEAEDSFLKRIFTLPEFQTNTYSLNQIDYNRLSLANVVILNEISAITRSLSNILQEKTVENAVIIFIPSAEGNLENYNVFLNQFNAPLLQGLQDRKKLITNIAFQHPLFTSVFEQEVRNFEYPEVRSFYNVNRGISPVIGYEDNNPFLLQVQQLFLFTAPINKNNSNFINSPLVVPTFYNIGVSALPTPQLYYRLSDINEIEIPVKTGKDEVLNFLSEKESFIPQQQSYNRKVKITTQDLPEAAGNFDINYNDDFLGSLSYNYNRQESDLQYTNLDEINNLSITSSIPEYFDIMKAANEMNALWKWFVILAIFFLILESLLLKFFK